MSTAADKGGDVAVIGAGISGAVCANNLAKQGFNVSIVDMGKQHPGGRASRRSVSGLGLDFDHGVQFFKSTSPDVSKLVQEWVAAGVVAEWHGRVGVYNVADASFASREDHWKGSGQEPAGFFSVASAGPLYVGTPTMDAICTHLLSPSQGVKVVRLNTRVHKARLDGRWQLWGQPVRGGSDADPDWHLGTFDAVVFADSLAGKAGSPGHVAIEGTTPALDQLMHSMSQLERVPLFSLMMAWDQAQPVLPFDGATLENSQAIEWVCHNTSKPGRKRNGGMQCWVAVTRADYARSLPGALPVDGVLPPQGPDYLQQRAQQIYAALQQDLQGAGGSSQALPQPKHLQAQRWGSAYPHTSLGVATVSDKQGQFAACGDYCLGAGVENAVRSGLAAADAIADMLQR